MKRFISILCAVAMAFTLMLPNIPVASAENGAGKRIIDIVYDDSTSMSLDDYTNQPVDRWSQAMYAMEVFATMLGKDDEMNVFMMSDSGADPLQIKGSDRGRVNTLVSSMRQESMTPYETVSAAYSHISGVSSDAQRWLVVLTDGKFQHLPGDLQSALSGCAGGGVKVVYLGIGSGAETLQSSGSDFFAYQAASSTDVLGEITTIANQIFQQQVLPSSHISVTGNTMTLDIDIPVSQILVFAQGQNISIDSLTCNGKSLSATESNKVEVGEKDKPVNPVLPTEQMLVGQGLAGLVQTYTASGTPMEKGEYLLQVSDTSNVEIYYIAGATIDCCLVDGNGVEVTSDETHYEGTYGVSWQFLDPTTGEILKSDLLDGAVFTAVLKNGDDVKELDDSVKEVHLQQGEVTLEATAELPGHVTVSCENEYTVFPEPIKLKISAQNPEAYRVSALGEEAKPIVVTVTNAETNEKLSEAEWNATELKLRAEESNLEWLLTKGSEPGTWEIRPKATKDMKKTDTGSFELTLIAEYQIDNQAASGSGTTVAVIGDYVSSEMKVEIVAPADKTIQIGDEDGGQAKVVVRTKNEYTGEYETLTKDQMKHTKLKVECEDLNWSLSATEEPGVWELTPQNDSTAFSLSLKHPNSVETFNVLVSGTLEDGELYYEGCDSKNIEVRLLGWDRIIPVIIGIVLIVFLLMGYLTKKKLKLRGLHPQVTNCLVHPRKSMPVKIRRQWLTYLLPYVSQRAVVMANVPAMNCRCANVVIKAAGGNSFYIVNIKSYATKSIKINGDHIDAKESKNTKFNGATTITCFDKTNKRVGEFSFM